MRLLSHQDSFESLLIVRASNGLINPDKKKATPVFRSGRRRMTG